MSFVRIDKSELDWTSAEKSISCYSNAAKFVLPVPTKRNLNVPYGFDLPQQMAMDAYAQGAEIRNNHYKIFEGHGDAFYNPVNQSTEIVRYDLEGDKRHVIVINNPTAEQARLLQQQLDGWMRWLDPGEITLSAMHSIMRYARIELGLEDQYVTDVEYVTQTMQDFGAEPGTKEGEFPEPSSPYGHKHRSPDKAFQAMYVEGQGELTSKDGMPEYFSDGAVLLKYPDGAVHILQPEVFLRDYKNENGAPFLLEALPRLTVPEHRTNRGAGELTKEQLQQGISISVVGAGVGGLMAVTKLIHEYLPYAEQGIPLKIIVIDPMAREGGFTYNRHGVTEIGMANPINQLGFDNWDSAINHFNRDPEKWKQIIPHIWNAEGTAVDPNAIITHNQFGEYLRSHNESLLRWIEESGYPVQVEFKKATVVDAEQVGDKTRLQLSYKKPEPGQVPEVNEVLETSATVLCIGNVAPTPLPVLALNNEGLPYDEVTGEVLRSVDRAGEIKAAYVKDATLVPYPGYYNLDDQAFGTENVREADHTTLIGTGNGAFFAVLAAEANGYQGKYTLISRTAELPQVHTPQYEPHGKLDDYECLFLTLNAVRELKGRNELNAETLRELLQSEIRYAEFSGYNWRAVIDSLNQEFYFEGNPMPTIEVIYQLLTTEEQAKFLADQTLVPVEGVGPDGARMTTNWNNARYRIPDDHWQALQPLIKGGRLEIINGNGFVGIAPRDDAEGFRVFYRNESSDIVHFDTPKIVNNTGPSKRMECMPRLIRNLVKKGIATPYVLGGLAIDEEFHLVAMDREKDQLDDAGQFYALGSMVSGASLASMTVPEIRWQSEKLAENAIRQEFVERGYVRQTKMQRVLRNDGIGNQISYVAVPHAEIPETIKEAPLMSSYHFPLNPNSGEHPSTASVYKINGVYVPERQALHEEIIEGMLAGKTPLPGKSPQFIMVAGGMSVGMTYMKRLLENENINPPEHYVTISPFIMGADDALGVQGIPEFNALNNYQHPERSPLLEEEYYDIVNEVVRRAVERGVSISYVDMGDKQQRTVDNVEVAKAAGYDTALFGLTVSPEGYFQAADRWQASFDRMTDHPRAVRIMRDFTRAWQAYAEVFDDVMLIETEYANSVQAAYPILKASRFDTGEVAVEVLDAERFSGFESRKHLNIHAQTAEEALQGIEASAMSEVVAGRNVQSDATRKQTGLRVQYDALTDAQFSERFERESQKKLAQRSIRSAKVVSFENRLVDDQRHAVLRPIEEETQGQEFASDVQRIVSCKAFDRLEDIPQYRPTSDPVEKERIYNRKSHTIYAVDVAADIASKLGLDAKSIALARAVTAAHDIGHAPFAHRGELVIQNALSEIGGYWDHDMAALRVLQERPDGEVVVSEGGLNLTLDVLECVAKRYWRFTTDQQEADKDRNLRHISILPDSIRRVDETYDLKLSQFAPIEGQIATAADWVSFTATDMADGLRLGEFTFGELVTRLPRLAAPAYAKMMEKYAAADRETQIAVFSDCVREMLIDDVVLSTAQDIAQERKKGVLNSASDVRNIDHILVHYSDEMKREVREFGAINYERSQASAAQRPPFRDIMSGMINDLSDGSLPMKGEWADVRRSILDKHLEVDKEREELLRLATDYFSTMLSDKDVWEQVELWRSQQTTVQHREQIGYSDGGARELILAVRDKQIVSTLDIADSDALHYPEPRADTYQRIVTSLIAGRQPAQDGNYAVVLGGGPNSGKTALRTALQQHFDAENIPAVFVSASDIKKALPEYAVLEPLYKDKALQKELGLTPADIEYIGNHLYYFVEQEVSRVLAHVVEDLTSRGYPVVVETHLHDLEEAKNLTAAAKSNGGKAILMAPDVDIPNFFHRGMMREATQGKFFMIGPSLDHQQKFEENWPVYAELFDASIRLDNNGDTPKIMAVAGEGREITVIDPEAYHRARQKIGINTAARTIGEALHYHGHGQSDETPVVNIDSCLPQDNPAAAAVIGSIVQNLASVGQGLPKPRIDDTNTLTTLWPEDVHAILAQLREQNADIGQHCLELKSLTHKGAKNSTYKISTETGSYVITLLEANSHDHNSSAADMERFHHFLYGYDCGVPVAEPIGKSIHLDGTKICVTRFVEGQPLEWLTDEQLEQFSGILGYFHRAGRHLEPYAEELPAEQYNAEVLDNKILRVQETIQRFADDPLLKRRAEKISSLPEGIFEADSQKLVQLLQENPTFLEDRFESLLPVLGTCPLGKVHGDIAPGNIMADRTGNIAALIDLMSGKQNYLIVEVVEAIYRHAIEWKEDGSFSFNTERARQLLEGYNEARPLLKREVEVIPQLLEVFAEVKLARRIFSYPEPKGFSDQEKAITTAENRLEAVRRGLARSQEWMLDAKDRLADTDSRIIEQMAEVNTIKNARY